MKDSSLNCLAYTGYLFPSARDLFIELEVRTAAHRPGARERFLCPSLMCLHVCSCLHSVYHHFVQPSLFSRSMPQVQARKYRHGIQHTSQTRIIISLCTVIFWLPIGPLVGFYSSTVHPLIQADISHTPACFCVSEVCILYPFGSNDESNRLII